MAETALFLAGPKYKTGGRWLAGTLMLGTLVDVQPGNQIAPSLPSMPGRSLSSLRF